MAINFLHACKNKPKETDFIWPGFVAGTVGALISPGGTGKSFWALEAAMAVACREEGGDLLDLKPKASGKVVYLAREDSENTISQRIYDAAQHLNDNVIESIDSNIIIEPTVGLKFDVMNNKHLNWIINYAYDARLIIFDTLSKVHSLDENSNGDMANILDKFELIARETEAAVLFLHHVSKGSANFGAGDQQQAARGASLIIDNARWCGFLMTMTSSEASCLSEGSKAITEETRRNYVRFGHCKQNYSEPIPDRWYKRIEGGILIPVTLSDSFKATTRGRRAKI